MTYLLYIFAPSGEFLDGYKKRLSMNSISYVWGAYNFFFLLPHHFRLFFQLEEDENILLNKKGARIQNACTPRGGGRSRMTHSSLICTYLDSLLLWCVTVISCTHIVTSRKIKREESSLSSSSHRVGAYRTTKRCYHIRHTIQQEPSILSNTFSLSIIK